MSASKLLFFFLGEILGYNWGHAEHLYLIKCRMILKWKYIIIEHNYWLPVLYHSSDQYITEMSANPCIHIEYSIDGSRLDTMEYREKYTRGYQEACIRIFTAASFTKANNWEKKIHMHIDKNGLKYSSFKLWDSVQT